MPPYINVNGVARRYGGMHPGSVNRAAAEGRLPKPALKVGNRNLWDEPELDEHDRQCAIAAARGKHTPKSNSKFHRKNQEPELGS